MQEISLVFGRLLSSWPSGPSRPPTWPSWGWTQESLIPPSLVTRASGMPTPWSPLASGCGRMAAPWAAPWGPAHRWTTPPQVCSHLLLLTLWWAILWSPGFKLPFFLFHIVWFDSLVSVATVTMEVLFLVVWQNFSPNQLFHPWRWEWQWLWGRGEHQQFLLIPQWLCIWNALVWPLSRYCLLHCLRKIYFVISRLKFNS